MKGGTEKPKAKGTARASQPRKVTAKSKSAPKKAVSAKSDAEPKRATRKAASLLIDERIKPKTKAAPGSKPAKPTKAPESEKSAVVLLSGGNPQIAKGDGDAPVQAYIAAMPGWKRDLGKRLDDLIVQNAPDVRKAVKWNSPFYGIEGQGWFLSFHVFTRYVKVTFFNGLSLKPIPFGGTERSKDARWIDIHEDDPFDEAQFEEWVKQAAALPGWVP